MDIRPIRTEAEYRAALRDVSAYFDDQPARGTEAGDRFDVLLVLVQHYEAEHFPVDSPDPIEAIKFRMEQSGLAAADLIPAFGRRNRVHEVLTGKRALTLKMIRILHNDFGIPAASLIQVSSSVLRAKRAAKEGGKKLSVSSPRIKGMATKTRLPAAGAALKIPKKARAVRSRA